MKNINNFDDVYTDLEEISKFVKFKRKEIAKSLRTKLEGYEYELSSIPKLEDSLEEITRNYIELEEIYKKLDEKNNELTQEHTDILQKHQALKFVHAEVTTKYDLVSAILGAKKSDNQAMVEFEELVENDFLEFANKESSLAEEAKALLMLQNIQRELQMISSFPSIYNKTIVAVGGGFSAGKSEFISSFFADKTIKLPIGIKPVTAIPTYISNGKKHIIKGYSYKGGSVNISSDLYADLSHDFIKSFSFNLKDIVPMMAIETNIKQYNNICFIDTPGYNPTDTGTTDSDYQTASTYLENANVLLWIIGLDASDGAIPASDLEFLEELSLENKKLFIVANKADLKSPDDLEEILDSFEDMLDEYDIEYWGISAYNSIGETEISFRKKSLVNFLQDVDSPVSAKEHIVSELNEVFDMYKNAINEQLKWTKNIQLDLKSLELDFMQDGMDIYESERANQRLEKIRELFDTKILSEQLKELESLKKQISFATNNVFQSLTL